VVEPGDVAALREQGDAAILRAALQLEEEAVARYAEQSSRSTDPRLFTYWEALRRNETEHRDELRARLVAFEGPGASS
jgi:rubrerythrin